MLLVSRCASESFYSIGLLQILTDVSHWQNTWKKTTRRRRTSLHGSSWSTRLVSLSCWLRALPESKYFHKHMRILAGSDAEVHFTHLSHSSTESLKKKFGQAKFDSSLARASCHKIGVLELMKDLSLQLDGVCLLDPKADKPLSPEDGDGRFKWFLFGVGELSLTLADDCSELIVYVVVVQGILGACHCQRLTAMRRRIFTFLLNIRRRSS